MRSIHGAIQPPPDSRNPTRKRGWRSTTPPQITAIAASIISIVCEIMWRAARSLSKRSTPKGGIDPVRVHVDNAGVRIEPALLSLGVFQAVELDRTLPHSDRAEAADPAR